jgi:hypothetical protein
LGRRPGSAVSRWPSAWRRRFVPPSNTHSDTRIMMGGSLRSGRAGAVPVQGLGQDLIRLLAILRNGDSSPGSPAFSATEIWVNRRATPEIGRAQLFAESGFENLPERLPVSPSLVQLVPES